MTGLPVQGLIQELVHYSKSPGQTTRQEKYTAVSLILEKYEFLGKDDKNMSCYKPYVVDIYMTILFDDMLTPAEKSRQLHTLHDLSVFHVTRRWTSLKGKTTYRFHGIGDDHWYFNFDKEYWTNGSY